MRPETSRALIAEKQCHTEDETETTDVDVLRSAQAEKSLKEKARTLEVLNRAAIELASEQDADRLVQIVTDAGRELSHAAYGAFFYNVVDNKGEAYMLYSLSGQEKDAYASMPMPRKTELFAPTFEGAEIIRLADVRDDPRFGKHPPYHGFPEGHVEVRSYLAVPVVSSTGEVFGGLFYGHPEARIFTEDSEQVIATLAAHAAVAIDRSRLHTALQKELGAARQAELSSRLLAAIVESSEDAIIGKDLNGIITSWNKGAQRIFGYTPDEIIGRPVTTLMPLDRQHEEAHILSRMRSGRRLEHYETVRQRKDGTKIEVSLTISPIKDSSGKVIGISKILRDITAQKEDERALRQASEELVRAKDELELRVEERTASLKEAIAQMEEFSYTISHDLRAPLRAMKSYSSALTEDFGHLFEDEPEAKHYLERIEVNALRLDRMIQDVLTYGRVARGSLCIERVSLNGLLQDLVEHYPILQEPNATLEVGKLDDVMAHEPSLAQALSNLLTNAVKFVSPAQKPKVSIWSERVDNNVRLWIEDNGIGIDPKYQHRLFTMFERIHPHLPFEGTGVGLAIVRKAVERMGGKVGLVSDGVSGSRFWVQLPAAEKDS